MTLSKKESIFAFVQQREGASWPNKGSTFAKRRSVMPIKGVPLLRDGHLGQERGVPLLKEVVAPVQKRVPLLG